MTTLLGDPVKGYASIIKDGELIQDEYGEYLHSSLDESFVSDPRNERPIIQKKMKEHREWMQKHGVCKF